MGIFNYLKRRKLEKQRIKEEAKKQEALRITEQKRIYRLTKEKIDEYIRFVHSLERNAYSKAYDLHSKYIKEKNSKCPLCGSKNVHEEYKRIKGELSGSFSGSNSSSYYRGLFYGSGNSSGSSFGKINGALDTIKILKCSECGQEWEPKTDLSCSSYYAGKIDISEDIGKFMRGIYHILDIKYDPEDITEEFDSYEEKRSAEINNFLESLKRMEYLRELPIEVLWTLSIRHSAEISDHIRRVIWKRKVSYDNWGDICDDTTYSHLRNEYICEFSSKTVSLLEELGFKHIDLDSDSVKNN